MCRKEKNKGAIERRRMKRETEVTTSFFMEARLITKAHLFVIPLRWMRSPVESPGKPWPIDPFSSPAWMENDFLGPVMASWSDIWGTFTPP
ncbi:hypothetical protein CEXT_18261 [Caerostris extrusa]|uniref:Uncharacterized protein n=1 Tax=Caerostris extrusa TaxID=172846 RepID=A0AAV4VZS0_CAEEX|nr:hypothetical protein CEXT_18261 [Caerostris extrusa]